ncbi:MAG: hypothetical protein ACI8X5_000374 [Planctomycetota bacterium]|jgi:hypothetical protein
MLETLAIILLTAITAILWTMVNRQSRMESRLGRLDRLDEIRSQVTRIADAGGDLELRRLEHVLIDIRDGQKRFEERLLLQAESARQEAQLEPHLTPVTKDAERSSRSSLSERIHNRLLAMGYERIQLLTPFEELSEIVEQGGEGEVMAEARLAGAVCKGRIVIRGGTIAAVELKGSHAMFP